MFQSKEEIDPVLCYGGSYKAHIVMIQSLRHEINKKLY